MRYDLIKVFILKLFTCSDSWREKIIIYMLRNMASDMKSGTLDLNFGPATGKLCISFLLLLLKQDYHKFSGLNNTRFFFLSCLSGSQNSSWAKIKCRHSCVPFRGCNGESFSLLLSPCRGHPTFLGPFLYLQSQQILQRQSSLCSPFSTSHFYF